MLNTGSFAGRRGAWRGSHTRFQVIMTPGRSPRPPLAKERLLDTRVRQSPGGYGSSYSQNMDFLGCRFPWSSTLSIHLPFSDSLIHIHILKGERPTHPYCPLLPRNGGRRGFKGITITAAFQFGLGNSSSTEKSS